VYGITTADTSHTQDITRRQKQYILTMLVRVVSIIVVVCVPGISWQLKAGLCLVATIIPYVAVVRANGGPSPQKDPTNLMIGPPPHGELGAGQPELPGGGPWGEYVAGERVDPAPSDSGHTPDSGASQSSTINGHATGGPRGAAGNDDQGSDQASETR
jgi:hypothetical protein